MLKNWIVAGFLLSILGICGAGEVSAAYVHMFDCKDCHRSGLNYAALGVGNLCMSCHGEPPTIIKQPVGGFAIGDASHAFGHGNGNVADYQTSHTWSVSTDTVPAAGAQAPDYTTDREFYTRYGASSGRITCSRCHNPHALEGNPQLLVKGAGSGEAMCRACHVTWAQQTTGNHGLLSHPLVNDYASVASANPSKYRTVPVNDRRGEIQLVGGGVACTSCHGMHFVDSNSDTDDGKAQLDPEYPGYTTGLAQGDGKLLRADGAGRANKSVLCQSCHTYPAHGGTTAGTVGCMVCHSGHSYDPVAPNYFVLRKTATKPDGTVVTDLNYSNPDVLLPAKKYEFWNDRTDGTADGYCERCHGDAKDISDREYHVTNAVCTDCHKHNGELGAFGANCGACHGNADTDNSWPDGIANNILPAYSWADDAGSHAVHVAAIGTRNLSCPSCHPGNPPADHYLDATTGAQQAEVTRMDKDGNGTVDYWQFAEGAAAASGTAVYFKTATAANDADAYYRTTNQTCYNINCHGNVDLQWGTFGCLSCHATAQGSRAAVVGQFASNSHHVQGASLTAAHCYQCHWEANSNGSVNSMYHGGVFSPGSQIDLVVYGAGSRPTSYAAGTTAVQYTANGSRSEIAKLNGHCLGCHSDANNATTPFGDGKTPKQYAWDGTSVGSRYSQAGTTPWGKYTDTTSNNISPKSTQAKAYSAHGNATANQGGWDLNETWPNKRVGSTNVACYDCHNSHGSSVSGRTTSYASTTVNGGLLKETAAGKGGYSVSYKPVAGGTADNKNARNPGASLCFDCHMTATGGASAPWGYQSTFGATQQIMGYYDTSYLVPGDAGPQQRYTYRQGIASEGGHFGASSPLGTPPMASIDGLCTPCHDPHGVSPTLGSNQPYGVPLLKGTWLTSPYLEDVAPEYNWIQSNISGSQNFYIDQNTFGVNIWQLVSGISQNDTQFAGLCLRCHPKTSLTDGATHAWKSKDRVHEAVKGWKTANGTVKHNYPCSKCHAPHIGSSLPRLMVTNCMDWTHKGRVAHQPNPQLSYSEYGGGRVPGSHTECDPYGCTDYTVTCHEGQNGYALGSTDQRWNRVTPWEPALTITGPSTGTATPSGSQVSLPVIWSTNLKSDSKVDFGLTTAYGSTASNGSLVTNHNLSILLSNHSTYHYRVRSTTYYGQSAASADQTVYVSLPPTVPTLIAEADFVCASGCSVTLDWNASTDLDSGPIQYFAEVSTSATFASIVANSGWISTRSWMVSLPQTNTTYYWRVKSRDANRTTAQDPPSAWSSVDNFIVSDGTAPVTTLTSPANASAYGGYDGMYGMTFSWSSTPPGTDYLVQVTTDPTFATIGYSSGWITTTSWSTTLFHSLYATTTFYWRVQGRLAGVAGPWTPVWSFSITDYGTSSCPFLFTWDGEKFVFEADLYGAGKLATKTKTGYLKPEPRDYYLLRTRPALRDGTYELRLVEERYEVDYLDEFKLYAVDAPADRRVFAEKPQAGGTSPFVSLGNVLHTIALDATVPPSIIHVNSGVDVTAKLAADDGEYVVLNEDRNVNFTYQTLELDLGPIQQAPQVKIVMDAMSMFPDTEEGVARAATFGARTVLEVQDSTGSWVKVPADKGSLPKAPEFSRPYAFDISNIWLSDSRKVRFTFLFKTYVDWILVDTTADLSVTITEVPMVSAILGVRGIDPKSSNGELYEYVYGEPTGQTLYLPGNYTRLGDVKPLLTTTDDKFVIYGGGDELVLSFRRMPPPGQNMTRSFLVYTNGYYKDVKVDVPHTVAPLPFAAMSNFPYDETVEHYPDDADHTQYLQDYNTRVVSP